MLLWLIRFFKGWVEFKAIGRFPERLLNITSRYGVNLWNAHPKKGAIYASMSVSDYRKIRPIARKARVRTEIEKRHGLPFYVAKYKPRAGLAVGALLGVGLLLFLSNFVWTIQVRGTQNLSETEVKNILSQNGLNIGSFKGSIDVDKLKRGTLLEINELGWLSVNLTGSVASVELKEKTEKPEINLPTNPCNIKARCDGVITKINAQNGISVVKTGSGVAKGDLLVSGTVETKLETTRYLHARADVFADVNSNKELSIPKQFDYYSLTENKSDRKRLHFFWLDFPLTFSFSLYNDSAYTVSSNSFCLNGVALPFGTSTETAHELTVKNADISPDVAEEIFVNQLLLYEIFEKQDSTVKTRNLNIASKENSYSCRVEYVFNENIAESVDFSVTE